MAAPRFMTHNLGWKVVAILLATLVWMSLHTGVPGRLKHGGTMTFANRPVAVLRPPTDQRVLRVDPGTVDITVGGLPEVLERLLPGDLRVFVDLANVSAHNQSRRPVEVHAPAGATVLSVIPAEVTLQNAPAVPSAPPPGKP